MQQLVGPQFLNSIVRPLDAGVCPFACVRARMRYLPPPPAFLAASRGLSWPYYFTLSPSDPLVFAFSPPPPFPVFSFSPSRSLDPQPLRTFPSRLPSHPLDVFIRHQPESPMSHRQCQDFLRRLAFVGLNLSSFRVEGRQGLCQDADVSLRRLFGSIRTPLLSIQDQAQSKTQFKELMDISNPHI